MFRHIHLNSGKNEKLERKGKEKEAVRRRSETKVPKQCHVITSALLTTFVLEYVPYQGHSVTISIKLNNSVHAT